MLVKLVERGTTSFLFLYSNLLDGIMVAAFILLEVW